MTPILDMTAGSRMFWFDKHDKRATFIDKRNTTYQSTDRGYLRKIEIRPDIQMDWTKEALPFQNDTFYLVVFDPPHLKNAGENSWLAQKYGVLDDFWQKQIRRGFIEAMRVLKPNGTLVFKWNDDQIPLKEVLEAIDYVPLFGDKKSKTHWLIFMKDEDKQNGKR